MSDLNDFFAKKDKKKKKGAKAKGAADSVSSGVNGKAITSAATAPLSSNANAPADAKPASHRPNGRDDGWIDIDEERKAQVNTGGRTVADFKRDNDDKVANGDGDAPTEKFSGWTIKDSGEKEENEKKPGAAPAASYPSLAETADAPLVPKNAGSGGGGGGGSGSASRPRYGGGSSGFAAGLRKMLEERKAAEAGGAKPSE